MPPDDGALSVGEPVQAPTPFADAASSLLGDYAELDWRRSSIGPYIHDWVVVTYALVKKLREGQHLAVVTNYFKRS